MKYVRTQLKDAHTTRDGVVSKIADLTTSHLNNIIKFWTIRAYHGVSVSYPPMDDGKGNVCEDGGKLYYDGVAILREISLLSYIIEYNKRDNCFADYNAICKEVGGNGSIRDEYPYDWD
tara:strand:- start:567 stop:923 length:357 start_codon:yes stop_codon:yes gene_type:complete